MLRSNVLAAKRGWQKATKTSRPGTMPAALGSSCALISNLRDAVIGELLEDALKDLGQEGSKGLLNDIAIVAHGGYGRRDVAPYSDVDLMILHRPSAAGRLFPLAERLVRDVFDVGLELGHSVRTVAQACRMACPRRHDLHFADRLAAAGGQHGHLRQLHAPFRPARRVAAPAAAAAPFANARDEERRHYGETVFLLEPNIKRSQGTLRDLAMLRWIGFVRYGVADFAELRDAGVLSQRRFRLHPAGLRVSALAPQ